MYLAFHLIPDFVSEATFVSFAEEMRSFVVEVGGLFSRGSRLSNSGVGASKSFGATYMKLISLPWMDMGVDMSYGEATEDFKKVSLSLFRLLSTSVTNNPYPHPNLFRPPGEKLDNFSGTR